MPIDYPCAFVIVGLLGFLAFSELQLVNFLSEMFGLTTILVVIAYVKQFTQIMYLQSNYGQ